ncbi:MAG TPA: hypothetical protein VHB77_22255 [Planctomycetaceae bacterium]|nr:hypothetical protein [Planctomycetaceae bacterium]
MVGRSFRLALILSLFAIEPAIHAADAPIALHSENPHYFVFRGQPTVLITSAEHYGAVLNRDFDFSRYLAELHDKGLNNTRLFTGAYCEPQGAFNIAKNTLAPAPGRFLAPWARSQTAGYANGGNKFDLTRWDDEYFERLRKFMTEASRHGVVVEMNLFCPFYEDPQWKLSPFHPSNNVNNLGNVPRTDVYTLDKHGGLLAIQEVLVRKIVNELREFDNLYYEICNEPYFGGVTLAWQRHIADLIAETERGFPHRHLISQNIANGSAKIDQPHPQVSIFNFHYASPPNAVGENYALGKVIGDNETGFKGTADTHYRREGWEFILAGGGLYNNLDYSFAVGHEDGSFEYPGTQPGGGSAGFRRQMQHLHEFIRSFDFVRLKPDRRSIKAGVPDGASVQVLVEPGRQYAVYLFGGRSASLQMEMPAGEYTAEWIDPASGKKLKEQSLQHAGGNATLASPAYETDVALRIRRQ